MRLIAGDALRRSDRNPATIAEAVGYEPDTAFSLAFRPMSGSSRGRYRIRMQRLGTAA